MVDHVGQVDDGIRARQAQLAQRSLLVVESLSPCPVGSAMKGEKRQDLAAERKIQEESC